IKEGLMNAYTPGIERMMKRLFDSLSENDRRRYAAIEATKLGHGGVEYIARVLGCDPKTIRQGQTELEEGDDLDTGRVEKKGWPQTVDRHLPDPRGELACDSLAAWWDQQGRADYPQAQKLLVLCDGGGSNSATMDLFKEDLQKLASRQGIEIRVAHYPPYCSKYNPIEHRLFPHLTRACRGVIFHTLETVRYYMAKAETTTGMRVKVSI